MYFIVTLNDCKASSFNRNMCGMKTKTKQKCVKRVSPVLGHSYNAAWIQRIRVGHTKSVGIKCAMYDQHVGHGTRLY